VSNVVMGGRTGHLPALARGLRLPLIAVPPFMAPGSVPGRAAHRSYRFVVSG
jgi:hypothetical protein